MKMKYLEQNGLRRPGGIRLTERAASLARFPHGAKLLDVCCGTGATVRYLEREGYDAWGIDLNLPAVPHPHILRADAK